MPWGEYYISLRKPNAQMYKEESIEFGKKLSVGQSPCLKTLHVIYFDISRKLHMNTGEQNWAPRGNFVK